MKLSDVQDLQPLVEAVYQSAQRSFARLTQRQAELRQQLADLQESIVKNSSVERSEHNPALRAGADIAWQRWIDQRRKEINSELSRLEAERSIVRERLKVAFGRRDAVRRMMEQHIREASRKNRQTQL